MFAHIVAFIHRYSSDVCRKRDFTSSDPHHGIILYSTDHRFGICVYIVSTSPRKCVYILYRHKHCQKLWHSIWHTLWHSMWYIIYCGILSGIHSCFLYGIYIYYTGFIWNVFLHSIWHSGTLSGIFADILSGNHSDTLLALILTFFLA